MRFDDRRDDWLEQDDAALLKDCAVDAYRASGPGGQKRNKTSSAVRLRHHPSGLLVIAEESRSQHENKARALRRLREAIALSIRRKPGDASDAAPSAVLTGILRAGRIEISMRNPNYPLAVAEVLDHLAVRGGRLQEAAAMIGVTTGQLSKFIARDGKVLAAVNEIRRLHGLRPVTGG